MSNSIIVLIIMFKKSVGLGEWWEKFTTGNFSCSIVFTICTNQFFQKKIIKRCKSLKLISKMGFNKFNTNFRLEHSLRRKNLRTAFLDVPLLLPEIFHWDGKKSCVPFTFYPDLPEKNFFQCSQK